MTRAEMSPAAVLGLSFAAGSIPSSNIAARLRAAVDLRDVDVTVVGRSASPANHAPGPVLGFRGLRQDWTGEFVFPAAMVMPVTRMKRANVVTPARPMVAAPASSTVNIVTMLPT